MKMRLANRLALLGLALLLTFTPQPIRADENCTVESFGDAVDESAESLRAFSADAQPRLKQKLQELKNHKGWPDADFEAKGLALVHDDKLNVFDTEAAELLGRIDTLGTPDPAKPDTATCEKLEELKTASNDLMAVMRAKSEYLITRIDTEISASPPAPRAPPAASAPAQPERLPVARAESQQAPSPQPDLSPIRRTETPRPTEPPRIDVPPSEAEEARERTPPAATAQPDVPAQPGEPAFTRPAPGTAEVPKAAPEPKVAAEPLPPADAPHDHEPRQTDDNPSDWSTTTAQAVIPPPVVRPPPPDAYDRYDTPSDFEVPAPGDPPGAPYTPPHEQALGGGPGDDDGYTIDEIRDATRGFFGTVSTSLASVIEHAFQQSGRPTAYVLGQEGGAAFLAGLRYGEGTLYLRNGGQQQVYWHGPSIGYDIGGDGSRTLFLIYNLDQPDNLFRRFTGVDGSAYLVGGVGMTLLKGGPVTMAPIRSGLGLRLGASIGYVRFTPRPTWNPF